MQSAAARDRRKRSRSSSAASNNNNNKKKLVEHSNKKKLPATPPVICLTGFSQDEKEYYHGLIEKLGGSFTRTLDVSVNTHLLAKHADGPKYQAAVEFVRTTNNNNKKQRHEHFHIVRTHWLRECVRRQRWIAVQPQVHGFRDNHNKSNDNHNNDTHNNQGADDDDETATTQQEEGDQKDVIPTATDQDPNNHNHDNKNASLAEQLERALQQSPHEYRDNTTLFSPCHFVFIGFDNDTINDNRNSNVNNPSSVTQQRLSRLVRRGMGRIAWDFSYDVTHVVLPDGECDETVRDAAKTMQTEHPNAPSVIAPCWILACWEKKELLEPFSYGPSFLPRESLLRQPKKSKTAAGTAPIVAKSNLFRGCFFAFLRVAPPDWAVDYNTKELEQLIVSYSGQLLSSRIVEALMIDNNNNNNNSKARSSNNSSSRYKCYTVCWGGSGFEQSLAMHPTLGQIQRGKLCEIIQVTPNWLQTCCSQDKLISRSKCPTFFRPVSWPVRRLLPPTSTDKKEMGPNLEEGTKEQQSHPVRVALSGIRGSLRSAIIHWIRALGASVDDAMERHKTTHLICQVAAPQQESSSTSELKHEKAKEWGIHVVSVEWLFHVSQYGFSGKKGGTIGGGGCESQFPVSPPKRMTTRRTNN